MRRRQQTNGLTVQAIVGSNAVFFGFDLDDAARAGCLGFAIQRTDHTENEQYWLSGFKTFKSVVPNPCPGMIYSSRFHPVQSFYWGDYTVKPGHVYTYRVVPRFGTPKNLSDHPGVEASVDVTAVDPDAGTHGIYFNRGVAASQAYAFKFDKPPHQLSPAKQKDALTWLSRGLHEALVAFIAQANTPQHALRAAAYQFTEPSVLGAFKDAAQAAADVQIVYHASDEIGAANDAALQAAGLSPPTVVRRTKANIAHNKFIVLCEKQPNGDLDPVSVWTGSTNMSEGGIYGHSNLGHAVRDPAVAQRYLNLWTQLSGDPELDPFRDWISARSPFVEQDVEAGPAIHTLFSPRHGLNPLRWYGKRFGTRPLTTITGAFGLTTIIEDAIETTGDVLHFVLLDSKDSHMDVWAASPKVQVAVGTMGGPDSLGRWAREHLSDLNQHALYVHTKFLLVDPLGADPTVVTGSANFSPDSTSSNDENMLVIRGDTEVADVYFTEYARIFNHFYARYWAKRLSHPGSAEDTARSYLKENADWQDPYFTAGSPKNKQRILYATGVEANT